MNSEQPRIQGCNTSSFLSFCGTVNVRRFVFSEYCIRAATASLVQLNAVLLLDNGDKGLLAAGGVAAGDEFSDVVDPGDCSRR
jgi:hypothetical protein